MYKPSAQQIISIAAAGVQEILAVPFCFMQHAASPLPFTHIFVKAAHLDADG
jgi:hypothetical protein